jgi:predicted nucleic acid-binding OB-fold protein
MEQLAAAIIEYGRMRQEHYGSHPVLLGVGEVAMRLRETAPTIVKALGVLRDQGRA